MSSQISSSVDESAIQNLYQQLLAGWNRRSADDFAALFEEEAHVVGFDGSLMNGRGEIRSVIRDIFADHPTAAYVGKVKGVRFLTPEVAIVRAVAGMVPPGESALNPSVNTIQTLVTTNRDGQWRIALFQNTPAQFHGRPELVEALTEELSQLL